MVNVSTSQPPSRKGNSAKGRDRLIMVAMKLFGERGFDGVTVRDIVKEAGVSIGLINHHFDSKEGLRQAVDEYFLTRTSKAISRASGDLEGASLDQFASNQRNWITQYEKEWPSFVSYLRRAISDNSEWGANLFRDYHASISKIIQNFDNRGMLSEDIDRDWLTMIHMFILVGPIMLDPYIERVTGQSIYEPKMWGDFQRALQQVFWDGAGKG